ncbi:hypothetical protein TNCV_3606251 [Trichonephila clavipes]|nr:hypothetical protein TNCV_3606251 [Trichonephila clavipes]
MNGCVAALSVDTGKVVDIEIMSSYCPTCRKISKMPRSIEFETFAADHVYHSNFQGSALKIEAVCTTRIFQRSTVKRGLIMREGVRLRKLKSKNKNLSGKGKLRLLLTNCKTIMGLLFLAMLETYPVFSKMLLWPLHFSSSVGKPMHGQCSIEKDGWCHNQRAPSCGKRI